MPLPHLPAPPFRSDHTLTDTACARSVITYRGRRLGTCDCLRGAGRLFHRRRTSIDGLPCTFPPPKLVRSTLHILCLSHLKCLAGYIIFVRWHRGPDQVLDQLLSPFRLLRLPIKFHPISRRHFVLIVSVSRTDSWEIRHAEKHLAVDTSRCLSERSLSFERLLFEEALLDFPVLQLLPCL
ncbi:hypothetical protein PLICRDRAFT_280578 [Plicaturopsis crispa FD-325 SS-3]|nr:hypothetical protein PLICRDRAFT_280578 [Plicaturopsis crispa FD-325 SS-3]